VRFLSLGEVLALHRRILAESGGRLGVRDLGAIASALSQPGVSVGGEDAYPTLVDKAAALGYSLIRLGYSLIRNHGFFDGNKRIAHAAMEVFLVLNGMELRASVDEQERFMLSLAAGEVSREGLADWLRSNTISTGSGS
jgi:death on curing protein